MRLLALGLTALWAATALAVAAAYRPGGPLDIVVIAICFAPAAVSLAGVRWPAEARAQRDRLALGWLWIGALLLGIPVLYGVASSLTAEGQSLAPSVEAAYSAGLALLAMSLSSVLGFVHARLRALVFERQASLIAGGIAVVLTAVVGALFGLVVLINETTLVQEEQAGSRFGPVGVGLVPPECDTEQLLGPNAAVTISARSILDDDPRGSALLEGSRRGRDEAWSGTWSGPDGDGQSSYLRLGDQAWRLDGEVATGIESGGRDWRSVEPDPFGLGGDTELTLDGPAHAVVDVPRGQIVAEDPRARGRRGCHGATLPDVHGRADRAGHLPAAALAAPRQRRTGGRPGGTLARRDGLVGLRRRRAGPGTGRGLRLAGRHRLGRDRRPRRPAGRARGRRS